jgi:hypothetical protein
MDAIISVVPVIFTIILYFSITNNAKNASSVAFLSTTLLMGGVALSALTLLSSLRVHLLPFTFAQTPSFSPTGSLLDSCLYISLLLPIAGFLAFTEYGKQNRVKSVIFGLSTIVLFLGLCVTLYKLFTLAPSAGGLLLLPFHIGFQTAFAAISQDTGRLLQGFLLGSGFGTFATDFTRFKPASLNLNEALWSFTFLRSSSFVLEILATTGVLGFVSYIFIAGKFLRDGVIKKHGTNNPFLIAVALAILISLLMPFTFIAYVLFFVLLALYATAQAQHYPHTYFDVELDLVALKRGIFATSSNSDPVNLTPEEKKRSRFLPVFLFIIILGICIALGFYTTVYTLADATFQRSMVAAQANSGIETYNLQTNAIRLFPYRDGFHRVYSQTNLALANSLAATVGQQQQTDSSPSAETQQTILTLIQQSINAGRNATNIAPLTSSNWQNLSSIYRGLIGFGENAQSFAVLTIQQAIAIDPNNPQGYLNLGGIYYQLGAWDDAIRQFQIAISLKPDFSNAYYNLGHALEKKGDLQNAVAQYKTVKTLVANDKENLVKIDAEIAALEAQIGTGGDAASKDVAPVSAPQQPLGVNTPATQLPQRDPEIEIPGPVSPTEGPTPTPDQSSSPTPTL